MNNRMPKIILNYRPKWTKTTLKTFGETSDDAETGLSRLNS